MKRLTAILVTMSMMATIFVGSGMSAQAEVSTENAAQTETVAGQETAADPAVAALPVVHNDVLNVNKSLNCVTVYDTAADGTLVPVKAMVCSCGRAGHSTPEGTFKTSDYYDWRLMVDGTYGRYAVRFNRKILFHSVPYVSRRSDTLEWDQYNLLGQDASLGCVRLSVADSKWIYDNCKKGTVVNVYSNPEEVLPIPKPTGIVITEDLSFKNWDPTDLDLNNPWLTMGGSVETFNYTAYADTYPNLLLAFGYNREALFNHYITAGRLEGREAIFTQ